jgi:hypothetical protein
MINKNINDLEVVDTTPVVAIMLTFSINNYNNRNKTKTKPLNGLFKNFYINTVIKKKLKGVNFFETSGTSSNYIRSDKAVTVTI